MKLKKFMNLLDIIMLKLNIHEKIYEETNTVDLYFDINEGKITKINKIIINGNNS